MITEALRDTIKRLEDFKKKGEIHERILRQEVYNIRQTTSRFGGQMSVKVKVEKKTITAIVDSGADINYVNKKW
jgi:hypothetical protein